jgi:hypothetical protein
LPNPLAGITTRPGDEVGGIPLPETAFTASVNLGPINKVLPDPLAGITDVKNFPDHQAHHPTPHQSEALPVEREEGDAVDPTTTPLIRNSRSTSDPKTQKCAAVRHYKIQQIPEVYKGTPNLSYLIQLPLKPGPEMSTGTHRQFNVYNASSES